MADFSALLSDILSEDNDVRNQAEVRIYDEFFLSSFLKAF